MSQLSAQLCHLVHLVHALTGQEVQAVQVLFIAGEEQFVLGFFDADYGLKDGALAFLNPLSHRVEVGAEINGCGEDSFEFLALALAV